jgi:hypothetical protein
MKGRLKKTTTFILKQLIISFYDSAVVDRVTKDKY